jgi:hypothetical protein
MKLAKYTIPITAVLVALVAAPAFAQQGQESFKGEVVAVQQQTQNQGTDQLITVRTRQGERKQFRLGDGSCAGCVQVGDQVRARVSQGGAGQPGQVRSMKVKRNGEMFGYSNQSGRLVRTQQRSRDGSGVGNQAQWQNGGRGDGSGRGNCGSNAQRGGGGGKGGSRGNGGGGR